MKIPHIFSFFPFLKSLGGFCPPCPPPLAPPLLEKVGYPGPDPGVLEGIYDPCFNQIHARNTIKHSETQIM